jgi:hypothetical protein
MDCFTNRRLNVKGLLTSSAVALVLALGVASVSTDAQAARRVARVVVRPAAAPGGAPVNYAAIAEKRVPLCVGTYGGKGANAFSITSYRTQTDIWVFGYGYCLSNVGYWPYN